MAVFKSSGKIPAFKGNLKICKKDLFKDPKQFLLALQLTSSCLFAEKIMLLLICLYSRDIQVVKYSGCLGFLK